MSLSQAHVPSFTDVINKVFIIIIIIIIIIKALIEYRDSKIYR